ncbi:MAG TPA: gliding motility-associated C-terminal domain-containing protein, partial [Ferruginibacter sp.]|nr:gliding motility-associated C-terminal domain-containing protein [Ferruginibacter sp.]
ADPIVSQPANITYILQVTDQFGCHSLKADSVFVFVQPPARLYAGEDTSVAINQPLQLHAIDVNSLGFNTYHWSPGTGLNNPDIANPIATLTAEYTQFIVEASTTAHCIGTDTIVVKTYRGPEIYVPTSFTPNGDGLNDLIRAIPIGMKSFHYFRIFNRFGETVFSTTDERMGWNGYFKGKKQNLNTFVWIAEAVDYKGNVIQRKGTFSILF